MFDLLHINMMQTIKSCAASDIMGLSVSTEQYRWLKTIILQCCCSQLKITEDFLTPLSTLLNYIPLECGPMPKRDGRPAEYRWRPLFNAVKFGLRSLLECCAVTLPRRETSWKLQGCLKFANRYQPLMGRSSPYCKDMWRICCCLSFFPIVDACLSCEDVARQSCAMVPRWRFWRLFCVLYFSEPRAAGFRPAS